MTLDRTAWETTRFAVARFAEEDAASAGSETGSGGVARHGPRLAVDLGCATGRDAGELVACRLA